MVDLQIKLVLILDQIMMDLLLFLVIILICIVMDMDRLLILRFWLVEVFLLYQLQLIQPIDPWDLVWLIIFLQEISSSFSFLFVCF